jgi:hypothetical protein
MTIATVDDAIAGALPPIEWQKTGVTMEAINVWHSLAYSGGVPGAMVAPTSGIDGAIISAPRDGLINFADASPDETRLMRASVRPTQVGTLLICDRLWDNSSIASTTTTLQAITSPTWPARDRNGATAGDGVLLGLEVSTATTNGGAVSNTTVTYTDEAGNGSRTATLLATPSIIPATAVAGTFVPFLLGAGDKGVRSVQGITLGTSLGTGVVHLVAYRPVASIGCILASVEYAIDLVTGGAVKLYDDSNLFFIWIPSVTTALGASGQIIFTQG